MPYSAVVVPMRPYAGGGGGGQVVRQPADGGGVDAGDLLDGLGVNGWAAAMASSTPAR